MKQRVKPIVMVVLLAVASAALIILPGLFKAEAAQATTCKVQSGSYPTIQSAVNDVGCDTINLTAAAYFENVTITRTVTLQGQGADSTTVDGNASGSVFAIQPGLAVTITDMTITNGKEANGGGIYNNGSSLALNAVTLVSNQATANNSIDGGGAIFSNSGEVRIGNSIISDNMAESYGGGINSKNGEVRINNSVISGNSAVLGGGGILNRDAITISNSSFSGNSSSSSGGAIFSIGGIFITNSKFSDNSAYDGGAIYALGPETFATISNVTFSGNSARDGGGIYNWSVTDIFNSSFSSNSAVVGGGIYNVSNLTVVNSTFSNNSAWGGGGIENGHPATFFNVTFNGNSAEDRGGAIRSGGGALSLSNTIIANSPSGSDCWGGIISQGYNIGSDDSCLLTAEGDRTNTNPRLGSLKGSPGYHPLLVGSPAINAGNPDGCTDHLGNPLPTDQLGQPRVGRCDIGAYEYQEIVHTTSIPVVLRDFCSDFFDDFSNPASGWDIVNNEFVLAEYMNGEYRVLSRNSDFFYPFPAPSCNRENYVLEADARWVGTPGSSYGLIFGITASFDNFYLYLVNTDYREFLLLRFYPGGVVTIVPITSSPAIFGGNATNHLKVTRNGAQITLGINGTVLGTWSDGKISGLTGAGIFSDPYSNSSTTDARFDNFSLTGLASSATAQITDGSARATSRSDIQIENHIPVPIGAPLWHLKDQ